MFSKTPKKIKYSKREFTEKNNQNVVSFAESASFHSKNSIHLPSICHVNVQQLASMQETELNCWHRRRSSYTLMPMPLANKFCSYATISLSLIALFRLLSRKTIRKPFEQPIQWISCLFAIYHISNISNIARALWRNKRQIIVLDLFSSSGRFLSRQTIFIESYQRCFEPSQIKRDFVEVCEFVGISAGNTLLQFFFGGKLNVLHDQEIIENYELLKSLKF